MTDSSDCFPVDRFSALLGKSKTDPEVAALMSDCAAYSRSTIDREDGADYEYLEVLELGFSLCFDGGNLASVFLYSQEKDSQYENYRMPLPFELTFGETKPAVLARCGSPSRRGGGEEGFFGFVHEWIDYELPGLRVHFEFAKESQKIQMVTLMPEHPT